MAGKWPVCFPIVGAYFSGGSNILSSSLFQNILRPPDPLRVVTMNGNQNAALSYAAVIALGLIFRDPVPTRAPTSPPRAPPTPRPASADMIGPAAINGPRPGIASAPIPTKSPSVPPMAAPHLLPLWYLPEPWCSSRVQSL